MFILGRVLVGARPLSGRAFSCTLGGWGGVGWGGVGWGGACVNVHVSLLGKWTRLCVCRYVRVDMGGVGWGGVGWGMC